MSWHGARVSVPASWPVYDLSRSPQTCVRFDRHAVYLGRPGVQENCPAHLVGRSEALLLEPVSAAATADSARLTGPSGTGSGTVVLPGGGVRAVATWNRSPATIRHALGMRALPDAPRSATAATASTGPAAHTAAGRFTKGLGFDPCATPSAATMRAWRSSPYHSVGVYLGGANMACAQPNLTGSWVRTETGAGWHLIPTYVGLQAPTTSCGCARINPSQAAAQGRSAANDALNSARSVGMGRGNPIIYDMEAYDTTSSATHTVLTFLAAWTATLHSAGYLSGVYSSSASGITDLVNAQGTSFKEPDEVWFAHWNDAHSVSDSYIPSSAWANHQRIHQFSGDINATYGGVTLNIDGDYLDGPAVPVGGPVIPDGTFIELNNGTVTAAIFRVAGGAPLPVNTLTAFGATSQYIQTVTQAQFNTLNPVPADGTFLTTTAGRVFRVAGGAPFPVSSWDLYGGPQTAVVVDEWAIDNLKLPNSHLNAFPASGTVVQGLPSGKDWKFTRTGRYALTGTQTTAVGVDDQSLTGYKIVPAPLPGCKVPRLTRLTLSAATRALTRAHCRLGKVTKPKARSVPNGRVLVVRRQSTPTGHQHSNGYRVSVTLG